VNLGVVELSPGAPVRQDIGGGKVCILRAESLGVSGIQLIVTVEKSGREIASTQASPVQPDQPLQLSFGGEQVSLTPHIK
jgi:hypothetical protein